MWLLLASLGLAAEPVPDDVRDAVAAELRTRAEADQAARRDGEALDEIDRGNTEWLKQVVADHGWPDAERFGETAASDAWLLLQHARDLAFQREGLALIEPLVERGLVKRSQYALLVDRVHVRSGEPQVYGSQFMVEDGVLRPCPVEDPESLEARRAAMELPTMKVYRHRLASISDEKVRLEWLPDCEELVVHE